ncbi:MAG: PLP-dependent cysteine synthase family protein [Caldisphaera sp.]|nr:MAG: pyridoxal-5'-phosphate-dependent protein subunit beta [Caldisphaera sp.]PMP89476.1 MAG: pyridoxal-5'-phosphate-dependent protein subunit beta [Caldisphaera sp.]
MAKVENIDNLKANMADYDKIIDRIKEILKGNTQRYTVVINENNKIIKNEDTFWALKLLGAKLILVSDKEEEVNISIEFLGYYDEISDPGIRVYNNTLELVNKDKPTPIVKLNNIIENNDINIWAKLEWYNPFSQSIKDRTAWYIIENSKEEIKNKEFIYEVTSANTGIALAAISSILNKKSKIFIPKGAPEYALKVLEILGSIAVVEGETTNDLIKKVIDEAVKDNAFVPNQFKNIFNVLVHIRYTSKEIEYQARYGKIKIKGIFASMGTGGHIAGISFYFHNRDNNIKVFGVQPKENSPIPGIKRQNFDDWWLTKEKPDLILDVSKNDAISALKKVAKHNGIIPGLSSGAVLAGIIKAYNEGLIEKGDYICILPDNGLKYLNEIIKSSQ